MIPFGEWAPDRADFGNAATVATNVIPKSDETYGPFSDLSTVSDALTARCQGAFAGRDSDGNVTNFSGDASKLYRMVTLTQTDISRSAGYATVNDATWRFCQYGNRVIATNFADEIQSYVMGSSSIFANLSSGAPKARHVAVINPGFVMVGNTYDSVDGNVPNRVWWSEYLDPTSWPTVGTAAAQAVQSDYNDIPTGGWVQAITGAVGGAAGAVFMDTAIYRMDYEGPPTVFRFTEVERLRGTPAPNSVINVGPFAAYLGEDGFYMFDGSQSRAIGNSKVDKTFYADLDQSYFHRISGAADPVNKLLIWAYPGSGHSNGNPNKLIIFNWESGRWSEAAINCELIFRALSTGYTLDGLDTLGYTLETLPFSLDSRVWTGGRLILSGFDAVHKLGYFNGSNLAATIETGEFPQSQELMYVDGIRPMVDGGTVTAAVGYRATPSASISYTSATSAGDDGVCPQRISARYARARVSIAAGGSWTHAQGIEPRMTPDGER
tara:strand:+ start:2230 stop:3714 length:1485 start_codon:yes stop_codon:yes gene_type:complete